jgi:hypothetical protein
MKLKLSLNVRDSNGLECINNQRQYYYFNFNRINSLLPEHPQNEKYGSEYLGQDK